MGDDPTAEGQEPEGGSPPASADQTVAQMRKAREQAREWRTKHDEVYRQLEEERRKQGGSQSELDRLTNQVKSLTERVQAAEQAREQAQLRALRVQVASRKGLPARLAARLQGETEEDIEADADDILASLPARDTGGPGPEGQNGSAGPPPRQTNAGLHAQGKPPGQKT